MRTIALGLAAAVLAGLGLVVPASPVAAAAAPSPKVAIIVGATHGSTAGYRTDADRVYNEALRYTPNVVRVYSPSATWTKVQAAVDDASVVVYMGHGNGWPSPYTWDPNYTTKDGFGLNYDTNGDGKLSDYENRYYGEPSIRTLTPAPNAVVLLFHLCYASGNSEPGNPDPTLSVAKQRVDNYAAAFLRTGAKAVIADGHSDPTYYIGALFTTRQTIDEYWRNAPSAHGNAAAYPSVRTPGMTFQLDPESPGKYYRSVAGRMDLTTTDVTGAAFADTSVDPPAFVVPGNASPAADGAPVFGTFEAAAAAPDPLAPVAPLATLPAAARVRIDAQDGFAADGSAVFRVHTDDGLAGWMTGAALVPRDSMAPRTWDVDDGTGAFSPNGDTARDSWTLTVVLSEAATWRLRVVDADWRPVATSSGTGETATLRWAPAPGSVTDGSYRWLLTATDAWGNGPLERGGRVTVDTQAPTIALAQAEAGGVPTFTPNGDGSRDTIGIPVTLSEPGVVGAGVTDGAGSEVDRISGTATGTSLTLAWDGRGADGFVPDGRYTVSVRARDLAGNLSEPQATAVDVFGALSTLTAGRGIFFPQDGDTSARAIPLGFTLRSPATVRWQVVAADGTVVRTLREAAELAAGTWAQAWDGRDDAGRLVARGTYRSVVTASAGDVGATESVALLADAFSIAASDTTPARRQRITITTTTAEALSAAPKVRIYQPGISAYSVATTRIATGVYRVTLTLRWSSSGTLRLKVYGYDKAGHLQASVRYLPLH